MLEVVHAALPMDGCIWRVEWYGAISRNHGAPLEYLISVYFRKFVANGGNAPLTSDVTVVQVGIAAICSLPLGSLWQAGRLIGFSDRETIECTINVPLHRRGPLRHELWRRLSRAPFKFGSLEVPHQAGDERVVSVPIGQGSSREGRLAIPCFEVARAWFLRDSELTLRLLSTPIKQALDKLHDRTQTRFENGKLLLALRSGVSASAVPLIAALIRDPHFAACAAGILTSVVANHLHGEPKRLSAVPPIQGECKIRAAGEWGTISGKRTFFVHWLTAVELPDLPPIEWFWSDASEGQTAESTGDRQLTPVGIPTREVIRILHALDPSARERVINLFALGAEWINPPKIERRPNALAEVVERPQVTRIEQPLEISLTTEASTALPTDWGDGPSRAKYITLTAEGEPERRFMPASFDRIIAVAQRIAQDPEMSIRSSYGAFFLDDVSGFRRTLLGFHPQWALIAGRPRQALCVEIKWNDSFYYIFEVERRFDGEELSACLLGKSDRTAFTQSDVDRILSAYVRARGSWRLVHAPFWFRTLAHKFKDETTFSTRVCELIRNNVVNLSIDEEIDRQSG